VHHAPNNGRPLGVTALGAFFVFGTLMSLTAGLALAAPGGFLEPMWRLNPRAREGLGSLGGWGVALMLAVSIACAVSAAGLWRGAEWGRRAAMAVLLVNLTGDAVSGLSGLEPRALIGVPIGAALVAYLASRKVRAYCA
jgi:hypothetical protein